MNAVGGAMASNSVAPSPAEIEADRVEKTSAMLMKLTVTSTLCASPQSCAYSLNHSS